MCVCLLQTAVLLYPSRGRRSDPQREARAAPGQSRCAASAALSDRADEAVWTRIGPHQLSSADSESEFW